MTLILRRKRRTCFTNVNSEQLDAGAEPQMPYSLNCRDWRGLAAFRVTGRLDELLRAMLGR